MIFYELTDLENGQCVKGSAAALSSLTGVRKYTIRHLAKEQDSYQGRYSFRKLLEEEVEEMKQQSVWKQWDEIHQIYSELIAGERCIRKAADGKQYAVKV